MESYQNNLLYVLIILGVFVGFYIVDIVIFREIEKFFKEKNKRISLFFSSLRGIVVSIAVSVSVLILENYRLIPEYYGKILGYIAIGVLGFSITLFVQRLIRVLLYEYSFVLPLHLHITTVFYTILSILVWAVGIILTLGFLGVSVWPLLTALGVGGLVLGLAFQSTLTNLISGVYISLSNNFEVGDFIRLENGEEGFIIDISWRETLIKTLKNNLIVMPNSKLYESAIVNFSKPEKPTNIMVEIFLPRVLDVDLVKGILFDVVKTTFEKFGEFIIKDFEPAVFLREVGEFLKFVVVLRIDDYVNRFKIEDFILSESWKKFIEANIPVLAAQEIFLKDKVE